jgi:hypothetical protein
MASLLFRLLIQVNINPFIEQRIYQRRVWGSEFGVWSLELFKTVSSFQVRCSKPVGKRFLLINLLIIKVLSSTFCLDAKGGAKKSSTSNA